MKTIPIVGQKSPDAPITTNASNCRRDYKGLALCEACWNGSHCHRSVGGKGNLTNKIIVDCLGGACECPCRELLAEKKKPLLRRPPGKASVPVLVGGDQSQLPLFTKEVVLPAKVA